MSCLRLHSRCVGADRAAEVLRGHDVRRVDRPEVRELDAPLLEVDRAVPPVRHDDVAALPGHLVVRMHAGGGVDALDPQALAGGAPAGPRSRRGRDPLTVSVMPVPPRGRRGLRSRRVAAPWHGCRHGVVAAVVSACWGSARGRCSLSVTVCSQAQCAACSGRRRPARPRLAALLGAQHGDLGLEVLERLERRGRRWRTAGRRPRPAPAAARGSARPDLVAPDLGAARWPGCLLDPLGQQRQVVLGHRAALAGLADAGDDLGPAERLGHAAALDHREADAVSTVVNRRPHCGHERRRRMAAPSSATRLSTTRLSAWRQNGQCTVLPHLPSTWVPLERLVARPCGQLNHNLWRTYIGVTTRCREP